MDLCPWVQYSYTKRRDKWVVVDLPMDEEVGECDTRDEAITEMNRLNNELHEEYKAKGWA